MRRPVIVQERGTLGICKSYATPLPASRFVLFELAWRADVARGAKRLVLNTL